ncbi:MAG: xanthine dehydrogenase accessory protein XdhC, partial [Pseudomonadota bacterium]
HGQREPAVLATALQDDYSKVVITANNVFCENPERLTDRVLADARFGIEARRVTHRTDDWLLELIVGSNLNIAVFGAGHVGSAVVRTLSTLDCNIRWIDSRRNVFRQAPNNVRTIETPDPAFEVAAMPPGSCYLVMTHSHSLDYEICDRILTRNDAAYCGLIGSVSKRRRFEKRYRAQGMPEAILENLVCPIGVEGISGKKPAEIAVAASADVLRAFERAQDRGDVTYPDNVHRINPINKST